MILTDDTRKVNQASHTCRSQAINTLPLLQTVYSGEHGRLPSQTSVGADM